MKLEMKPHWKKIWLSLKGESQYVTAEDVKGILNITGKTIVEGITIYKEYSLQSFNEWKSSTFKESNDVVENFIRAISVKFNIDAGSAWIIFCNYMIYEYYGKIEDIDDSWKCDVFIESLMSSIWKFYKSERMFMIKILRFILGNIKTDAEYKEEFILFLKEHTISKIRDSLFKQLTVLIDDRINSFKKNYMFHDEWSDANYREQLEIMISILTTSHYTKFDENDIKTLFNIFQKQNMGDVNLKEKDLSENFTVFENIKCIQNATIIVAIQHWWHDKKLWLPLEDSFKNVISHACQDTDYSVVYLIYSTLLASLENVADDQEWTNDECQKCVIFAIYNKVFKTLYNILCSPVLQSNFLLSKVRRSCCFFMEEVCYHFNNEDFIYKQEGSILVLCELLKEHMIVVAVLDNDFPSLKTLYKTAVKMFPVYFEPLTYISKAIVTHTDYIERVIKDLESIQGFTELYSAPRTDMETHTLSNAYMPFDNDTLVIESGTPVIIWKGLQGSTFKVKYSYFTVLQRLTDLFVTSLDTGKPLNSALLQKIILGFDLFHDIAQHNFKSAIEKFNINGCISYINHLIINSWKKDFDDVRVLKLCFKFSFVIMKYREKETIDFLVLNNYLPKQAFKCSSLLDLLTSNLYQNARITKAIFKGDFTKDVIELIELYLDFVQFSLKIENYHGLHTTGLVFALLYIYPKLTFANFEENSKLYPAMDKCLKLLIFVIEQNLKKKSERSEIYEQLFRVMMDSDSILKALIRIFAVGNTALQEEMEKETNWESGKKLIYLSCFKKSLIATKLFLTALNVNFDENQQRAITRKMCQIHYQKRNFIKILSSFLNYSFDVTVPKIICRIINCLAQNQKLLIYAMLEADHQQVNAMFLDRLRDPLYDDDTKVAIIELVATCVESQYGMTAAFFDVYEYSKKTNKRSVFGENIANFMLEYLNNIKKSPQLLDNPLQNAILHLFYQLWMFRRSYLIPVITGNNEFWSLLLDPLFREFKFNSEIYSKIFAIITVEMHSWSVGDEDDEIASEAETSTAQNGNHGLKKSLAEINISLRLPKRENLQQQIIKFLSFKNDFIKNWLKYLQLKMENELKDTDINEAFRLFRAWKNFVIVTGKVVPKLLDDELETVQLIKKNCLDGLFVYFDSSEDTRITQDYIELLLLLTSRYNFSSESSIDSDFEKLLHILGNFANCYTSMRTSIKEYLLTILIRVLEQYSDFFNKNLTQTAKIVEIFCKIFVYEHELMMRDFTFKLENEKAASQIKEENYQIWVLIIAVMNKFLKLENIGEFLYFFKNYQVLPGILRSVENFISDIKLLKIAKITVLCLVTYAKSPISEHFLMLNLNSFYESIRPPLKYMNTNIRPLSEDVPWYMKEFWTIYTFILNLLYILQAKFQFLMLDYSLSFMHLYDDILKHLAGLVKLTIEKSALYLTCACLKFFEAIFEFKSKWWSENQQSFNSILNSIKETLNISVGVILRPNILVFNEKGSQYLKLNKIDNVPEKELVNLVDMHIQIIFWCLRCLLKCSPKLMDILSPFKTQVIFFNLVEHDYRVPKLIVENPENVTYGTLICTMHFLCKTMAQIMQHSNQFIVFRKKKIAKFKGFNILGNSSMNVSSLDARHDFHHSLYFGTKDEYFSKEITEIYLPPEVLHATQRFVTSGVSGMSVPWLTALNSKLVAYTLELLTTFMAQQIFVSLQQSTDLDSQQIQYVKRELCSELQFFHHFIRKRVGYLYDYNIQSNQVFRSFARKSEEEIQKLMPNLHPEHERFWGVKRIEPEKINPVLATLLPENERCEFEKVPYIVEEDYLLLISHWFINMCSLTN